MTTAQKQNVARFKAVQVEAKKLKAKNKKLTHQEAVKQAWAIMLRKKPAAKKKTAKKVGAVKKKAAPKKKAITKKATVKNYGSHKDVKSHNVKISVMSGINKTILTEIQNLWAKNIALNKAINEYKNLLSSKKYDVRDNKSFRNEIIKGKKFIKENNIHLKELKKFL